MMDDDVDVGVVDALLFEKVPSPGFFLKENIFDDDEERRDLRSTNHNKKKDKNEKATNTEKQNRNLYEYI
jgi:hypothetical protein